MDELQGLQSCQQGDVGLGIVVAVVDSDEAPIDLRAATSKVIRLTAPDGISQDKDAAFSTDGSDGQLVYVTQAGDLAEAGAYSLQAIVAVGGQALSTKVSTLQVLENLPAPAEPEA
ncbi:MAG: BppU family phage baseplate upper protein [Elusimicrobia bacterium]|nr:BppU family phage baseplate upper protein [Elusimicrobiota bacterium]